MSKKTQRILRYLLILFAVLVVAAIAYRIYQIQQEKRDFAKAEQSIDSLALQIEQLIGKPAETRKEKTCARASRKFDAGPLACTVSSFMLFRDKGLNGSNDAFSKVSNFVTSPVYESLGRDTVTKFTDYEGRGMGLTLLQDFQSPGSDITCKISYTHPVVDTFEKVFEKTQLTDLRLAISCGGPTIKALYPMHD